MSQNPLSKFLMSNIRARKAKSKPSIGRLASVSMKQFALTVEPLEERQLLAINVTQANLEGFKDASGGYVFTDSSSITVDPGVVIDAGAGAITMTAPEISIGAGAQIKTTGAISLTADKSIPLFPISIFNQLSTITQALAGVKASVAIGENVSIAGGSFKVDVKSGDQDKIKSVFESGTDQGDATKFFTGVGESFSNTILQLVNDVLSLPLSVQVKQPSSSITVGAFSVIKTTGDVKITEKATADATGQAIWSSIAQKITGGNGFGFAFCLISPAAPAPLSLVPSSLLSSFVPFPL
ncbi:MAG: hypothetical protein ACKO5E_03730, partial [bacterium]